MNIQNYQSQVLQPNQAQFLQQPQQKATQLQFNDLFHNINSSSNNNNTNSVANNNNNNNNNATSNNAASLLLNENNQSTGGLNPSQLLAQTLYQGQYRAQTPQQQRTLNLAQQQLPQQSSSSSNNNNNNTVQPLQPGLNLPQPKSIELDQTSQSSSYWQDQVQLVEVSRKSNLPHFYARHAAIQSRRSKQFPELSSKQQSLVELTKQILGDSTSTNNDAASTSNNNGLLQNRKISHALNNNNNNNDDDTNDDDYDDELGEPRIKYKSNAQQLWGSLDLSGQDIPNLSLNLFKYDFLTKLYLNGNKLSKIPIEIKNLQHLKILDLSNNELTSLPYQLGLLYNLKYLYLFDNNLSTLPYEFGNLFELHFLGIEGNPNFNSNFAKILAQKGTRSLIIHLRDNAPNVLPLPKRQWISLKEDGELEDEDEENNEDEEELKEEKKASFTASSFNILCHHYATAKLFGYTPSWALNWEYRKELIKQQILEMKSDVICLQEVETQSFEDYWLPLLTEQGYRGLFHAKYRARRMNERDAKKVDGCAMFYKYDKFSLMEKKSIEYTQIVLNSNKYKKSDDVFNRLQNRDNIGLVTILKHLETGEHILVANTHLHWDPALNDVKTVQVGVLLEEIELIVKKACKEGNISNIKDFPMFICGDFNSQLHSAVYKLLANGFVKDHEDVEGRDYGKFTEVGFQHSFNLRSAYDNIGELPFTNFTPSFTDVLDYIWYTPNTLSVRGLLGKIDSDYTSHYVGFPNAHLPSDHIPLMAEFHLRNTSKKENKRDHHHFKPEFRSSRKT